MTMTTQTENRDGIQLVHVSGVLDSMTYDPFEELLASMVKPDVRLVLDCENLAYINSQGLALLVHYQRVSSQNRSFLGIAGLNRRITRTIEMLGMGKLVTLFPTVEDALNAAAAP